MNREKEQAEQKLCRRYCRELRRALVCVPELRERTLAQITESMEEYLDEHPTADYQELVRVFGTPAQAAGNRSGRASDCLCDLSDSVWSILSVQPLYCRLFLLGKLCG